MIMVSLGDICRFDNGGTPSKKESEYWNGDIPWITSTEVTENGILPARSSITSLGLANSATKHIPAGTILLVTRTGVGKVGIAPYSLAFSQDITAIHTDPTKVDSTYLFRFLRNSSKYFEQNSRGATIKGITRDVLTELKIPLPLLPEQRRIAAILDKADAIRRKREEGIRLTEELLRSTFLEMFGDPATNPKGWDFKPLATFVRPDDKINYGVVQPGDEYPGGVPIVRVGDFEGLSVAIESLKRINPQIDELHKRSRLVGDEVLLACVGSIGRVVLADHRLKGFNTVRAVARIRCGDSIDRMFLSQYMQLPWVQQYFTKETRTVSQPTLNISHIEQTPIFCVPADKQRRFATASEKIVAVTESRRDQLRLSESLFGSLVQRAFRGEL